MKKNWKRMLALLLSAAMVLTMLPANVYAESNLSENSAAAASGNEAAVSASQTSSAVQSAEEETQSETAAEVNEQETAKETVPDTEHAGEADTPKSLSDADISITVGDCQYYGKNAGYTPAVTVSGPNGELGRGLDYTVSVGEINFVKNEGTVTITGDGIKYIGVITKTFRIIKNYATVSINNPYEDEVKITDSNGNIINSGVFQICDDDTYTVSNCGSGIYRLYAVASDGNRVDEKLNTGESTNINLYYDYDDPVNTSVSIDKLIPFKVQYPDGDEGINFVDFYDSENNLLTSGESYLVSGDEVTITEAGCNDGYEMSVSVDGKTIQTGDTFRYYADTVVTVNVKKQPTVYISGGDIPTFYYNGDAENNNIYDGRPVPFGSDIYAVTDADSLYTVEVSCDGIKNTYDVRGTKKLISNVNSDVYITCLGVKHKFTKTFIGDPDITLSASINGEPEALSYNYAGAAWVFDGSDITATVNSLPEGKDVYIETGNANTIIYAKGESFTFVFDNTSDTSTLSATQEDLISLSVADISEKKEVKVTRASDGADLTHGGGYSPHDQITAGIAPESEEVYSILAEGDYTTGRPDTLSADSPYVSFESGVTGLIISDQEHYVTVSYKAPISVYSQSSCDASSLIPSGTKYAMSGNSYLYYKVSGDMADGSNVKLQLSGAGSEGNSTQYVVPDSAGELVYVPEYVYGIDLSMKSSTSVVTINNKYSDVTILSADDAEILKDGTENNVYCDGVYYGVSVNGHKAYEIMVEQSDDGQKYTEYIEPYSEEGRIVADSSEEKNIPIPFNGDNDITYVRITVLPVEEYSISNDTPELAGLYYDKKCTEPIADGEKLSRGIYVYLKAAEDMPESKYYLAAVANADTGELIDNCSMTEAGAVTSFEITCDSMVVISKNSKKKFSVSFDSPATAAMVKFHADRSVGKGGYYSEPLGNEGYLMNRDKVYAVVSGNLAEGMQLRFSNDGSEIWKYETGEQQVFQINRFNNLYVSNEKIAVNMASVSINLGAEAQYVTIMDASGREIRNGDKVKIGSSLSINSTSADTVYLMVKNGSDSSYNGFYKCTGSPITVNGDISISYLNNDYCVQIKNAGNIPAVYIVDGTVTEPKDGWIQYPRWSVLTVSVNNTDSSRAVCVVGDSPNLLYSGAKEYEMTGVSSIRIRYESVWKLEVSNEPSDNAVTLKRADGTEIHNGDLICDTDSVYAEVTAGSENKYMIVAEGLNTETNSRNIKYVYLDEPPVTVKDDGDSVRIDSITVTSKSVCQVTVENADSMPVDWGTGSDAESAYYDQTAAMNVNQGAQLNFRAYSSTDAVYKVTDGTQVQYLYYGFNGKQDENQYKSFTCTGSSRKFEISKVSGHTVSFPQDDVINVNGAYSYYETCDYNNMTVFYYEAGRGVDISLSDSWDGETPYLMTVRSGDTVLASEKLDDKDDKLSFVMPDGDVNVSCSELVYSKKTISSCRIMFADSEFAYTGEALTTAVKVYSADGDVLTAGTDYTLEWIDNINQGYAKVIITGIGRYSGSMTRTAFSITGQDAIDNDIKDFSIAVDSLPRTYSGAAQTSKVYVSNGTELMAGTDYTVTWEDNINVGTARVTITGIGDYTGTVKKNAFAITEKSIEKADVSANMASYVIKDGRDKYEPEVTVTYGGMTLAKGTDYTVTYSNDGKNGTAVITGIGNFSGKVTKSFEIKSAASISGDTTLLELKDITVAADGLVYDGLAKTPEVTVTNSYGAVLREGIDYTLSYANNVYAGSAASVTAAGTGFYTGSVTRSFRIAQKDISAADVAKSIANVRYSSNSLKNRSVPVIIYNGVKLAAGVDYTLGEYSGLEIADGSTSSNAAVKVTGNGNYTGTCSLTYSVVKLVRNDKTYSTFAGVKFSLPKGGKYIYNGKAQTPEVTAAVTNGTAPVKDRDFAVTYADNVNAGTATVNIVGIGTYVGTKKLTFRIGKKALDVSGFTASLAGKAVDMSSRQLDGQNYNGNNTPVPVISDNAAEAELTASDVKYSYSGNNKVTAASRPAAVTVTGRGNYSGSLKFTFAIVQPDLTGYSYRINSLPYTGKNAAVQEVVAYDENGDTLVLKVGKAVKVTYPRGARKEIGTDYKVSSIKPVGAKNLKGLTEAKDVTYTIEACDLADCVISPVKTQKANRIPGLTVKINGVKLRNNIDYTVGALGNASKGTATATISAKDTRHFIGTQTVTYIVK